jgi:MoxR-like ATPase
MSSTLLLTPRSEMVISQFGAVEAAVQAELVERERELHAFMVCMAAGRWIFLLGDPGIAKTYMGDRVAAYVYGHSYYSNLIDPQMTKEDFFGPLDLLALKEGRYKRIFADYLPAADWGKLDEIWKAGPQVLTQLLQILLERKTRNDGKSVKVPLRFLEAMSNELPQHGMLAPLADRLDVWIEVKEIQDTANFVDMLAFDADPNPTPIMAWDNVIDAQDMVGDVRISRTVLECLGDLRSELHAAGIHPTDRRFKRSLRIVQAEAFLDGADEVSTDHLSILQHCMWKLPSQQAEVITKINAIANPLEKEIGELMIGLDLLRKLVHLGATDPKLTAKVGVEAVPKLRAAREEYTKLVCVAGSSRRAGAVLDRAKTQLSANADELRKEILGSPGSNYSI